MSLSRQKSTFITSSVPMMYSAGTTTGAAGVTVASDFDAAVLAVDCAAQGPTAPSRMAVALMALAILFERNLAVMFSQEVEEPLVVARLHVEQARDDLVVAARLLQPFPHHFANVRPRDFSLHEQRIDR